MATACIKYKKRVFRHFFIPTLHERQASQGRAQHCQTALAPYIYRSVFQEIFYFC